MRDSPMPSFFRNIYMNCFDALFFTPLRYCCLNTPDVYFFIAAEEAMGVTASARASMIATASEVEQRDCRISAGCIEYSCMKFRKRTSRGCF